MTEKRPAQLCFNDRDGFVAVPILVIDETTQRYRIEAIQDMRAAGRRRALKAGETALVPKTAVRFPDSKCIQVTRQDFMGEYRLQLKARYAWAVEDHDRLDRFMESVTRTLADARVKTWNHSGEAVTAAWRKLGGAGTPSLAVLRSLPARLKIVTSTDRHTGSSFDSFLEGEGIHDEVNAVAEKRVVTWQRSRRSPNGN
jgi:hypothetical protein